MSEIKQVKDGQHEDKDLSGYEIVRISRERAEAIVLRFLSKFAKAPKPHDPEKKYPLSDLTDEKQ